MIPIRFAFVMASDFDAGTIERRPLGGSESAVVYLSWALAARGHDVTLFTLAPRPSVHAGVKTLPMQLRGGQLHFPSALFEAPFDVVVLKNGLFETAPLLRAHLAPEAELWLWTGHAHGEDAHRPLGAADVVDAFDRAVFLSAWQRDETRAMYPALERIESVVARHAIAPAFENLFSGPEDLAAAKTHHGIELAYTSTPFRGLKKLVAIHPDLVSAFPRVETHVYSSMAIYGVPESQDPFSALYARAAALPGMHLPGPLPQPHLAARLRRHDLLAYSNTFAETNCVAVMEALASGLRVVTTALGALPEITEGWARLVAPGDGYLWRYAAALAREVQLRDAPGWAEARWDQVAWMNRAHTWARRATRWEEWARRTRVAAAC